MFESYKKSKAKQKACDCVYANLHENMVEFFSEERNIFMREFLARSINRMQDMLKEKKGITIKYYTDETLNLYEAVLRFEAKRGGGYFYLDVNSIKGMSLTIFSPEDNIEDYLLGVDMDSIDSVYGEQFYVSDAISIEPFRHGFHLKCDWNQRAVLGQQDHMQIASTGIAIVMHYLRRMLSSDTSEFWFDPDWNGFKLGHCPDREPENLLA